MKQQKKLKKIIVNPTVKTKEERKKELKVKLGHLVDDICTIGPLVMVSALTIGFDVMCVKDALKKLKPENTSSIELQQNESPANLKSEPCPCQTSGNNTNEDVIFIPSADDSIREM